MDFSHFFPYSPSLYPLNSYGIPSYQIPFLNQYQFMVIPFCRSPQSLCHPFIFQSYDDDKVESSKIQTKDDKIDSKQLLHGQLQQNQQFPRPSSKVIFKYGKKNVQSNVINQIFSYLSTRSKSKNSVYRLFKGSQQLICLYYQVMKQIKRKNKKYINRFYLKNLIEMQQNHVGCAILRKVDRGNEMKLVMFRRILRILTYYYLREMCGNAILTSSKLDKQTKKEHLERKREIMDYLCYHLKFGIKDDCTL